MKRFLASLLLMVFMMPFALQALEGGGADSKFFYDFNDGSIAGWKTVDRDNDGYCWLISGDGYIYSESSELLKPNNIFTTTTKYTIYPTSKITFDVRPLDPEKSVEKYGIGVAYSLDGISYVEIQDQTTLASTTEWNTIEIPLEYCANQEVYIGILHYTFEDQGTILVDNIKLTDGMLNTAKNVVATEVENNVNLTWAWDNFDATQEPCGYRVYRIKEGGNTIMIADNVTETTYQDNKWSEQEWGIYQWGVAALYEQQEQTRGEVTTLLEEGFETTEYPNLPEGWSKLSVPANSYVLGPWGASTAIPNVLNPDAGEKLAFSYGISNDADFYMVTPAIDLSKAINPTLEFSYAAPGLFENPGNTLHIKYSESSTGPWVELWSDQSNFMWKKTSVDLSMCSGGIVYIAFINEDHKGTGNIGIGIDNISIKSQLSENAIPVASRIAWSNPVEKDMNTVVKFTVATDDNGSTEGAVISLKNIDETKYTYEGTADAAGFYQFTEVRRGNYEYTVSLNGYYPASGSVAIFEETSTACILEKMPDLVEGLYVSPTGWAMWEYENANTTFDIQLNGELVATNVSERYFQHDVASFVEGKEYTTTILPKDKNVMLEYTWNYTSCGDFANAVNFKATKDDSNVTLTWDMPVMEVEPEPVYEFSVNFDNGSLEGWTTIDADGDGYIWRNTAEFAYAYQGFGVNNTYCATSLSYETELGKPLNPNNFLVSGSKCTITTNSKLTYSVSAQSKLAPAEHYGIAISTNSNTKAEDFTVIFEETLTAGEVDSISTQGQWFERTVDLSAYAGQEVYIAFRHYDSRDNSWIKVDNISLTYSTRGNREKGEWLYYDNGDYESAFGIIDYNTMEPKQIYWAIMFPADLIADYAKRPITKVAIFDYEAHSGAFSIHEGGDIAPGTMIHVQTYETTGKNAYVEIELDTPVTISGKENVWIQFSNEYGSGCYVAAYSVDMGDPNSRWMSNDGSSWYDANWFGEGWYGTWMIRAYVDEKDESIVEEPETTTIEPIGTIIFRNGELITPEPITNTTYTDTIIGEEIVNYTIRVVYGGEKGQSYYAMSCPLTKTINEIEEEEEEPLVCPQPQNLYGETTIKEDSIFGATLTWSYVANDGFDHYNIYRSTSNENYQLIGNTIDTTYFDTIAEFGTYYYQVTAVYTRGEEICESEPATAYDDASKNYVVVEITAINENDVINMVVYPNPVKDNLNISAENMRRITINNVLGQVVYDNTVNTDNMVINMSQYEAGIYMVRIVTDNGIAVKRISVAK